jgi:hypothetical protein
MSMVCSICRKGILIFLQTGSVQHPTARIYRCNCCGATFPVEPVHQT